MRVAAFIYPGPETWNHFQPLARLLRQLGHDLTVVDFSQHIGSDEDRTIEPPVSRLSLTDVEEVSMGRMDRETYRKLCGDSIDFAASGLYYNVLEEFAFKRQWLFLDSPFYQRLYALAHRAREILTVLRPDFVIVSHGVNPLPAVVTALCRGLDLPVLLLESPFFPGKIALDADGVHFLPGINRLDRCWPSIADRPLSLQQEQAFDAFFRSWRGANASKYTQTSSNLELERFDAFVHRARAAGQRLVFIPEQIPWDASVFLGLDRYAGWSDFLRQAFAQFGPDTSIVYKRHPKRQDRESAVPSSDNVLAVQSISIHAIFNAVDAIYTFSSNAGFEALFYGLPVACGGLPHYGNRGFTAREPRFEPLSAEEQSTFRRYAHHVIFEYLIDQHDAEALAARIQEAFEKRGQLEPAASPFAAAFPPYIRSFLGAVSAYNAAAPSNHTHLELLDGPPSLDQAIDPLLAARRSLASDVDSDGLSSDLQFADARDNIAPATLARYLLAAALLPEKARVLDIGCGCGAGCAVMADESSATVLGIDPSKPGIDAAWINWHRESRVEYRRISAGSYFDRAEESFDAITCFGVTQFLPGDLELLTQAWERLKPFGILLVSFCNATIHRLLHPGHVRHRSRAQLEEWLAACPNLGVGKVLVQQSSGSFAATGTGTDYVLVALKADVPWEPALFDLRLERALASMQTAPANPG